MSGSVPWYQTAPCIIIYRERLCILRSYVHTPRMEQGPGLVTLHRNSFKVDQFTKTIMPPSLSLICWAFVTGLKGRDRFSFTSSTPYWTVRNRSLVGLPFKFPLFLLLWERLLVPQSLAAWKSTNHFATFLTYHGA